MQLPNPDLMHLLIERSKNLRKHDYISNDYIQPTAPTTNSSSIYQDDNQGQEYLDSDLLLYDEDIFEEQLEEEVIERNENYGITRILKDPFHLMAQLKVPKKQSLAKEFARRLRDALFLIDKDDRRRIETYLQSQNIIFKYMLSKNPAWVLKQVKRVIPPPNELYPVVELLFQEYGRQKCSLTNRTLFDDQTWKQAENVLNTIQCGYVSDPPDVNRTQF
ncbi:hypothetical protein BDC45DRAFT_577112 [Circinella umbellata]|nr:hypothetical protein BDC45DRAFT_577112 [Circinella umbellata]